MINFRLEVFYTTAKEKSFTKAAEKLLISQPAVTKHIKALETHYKKALFIRVANNIELTTTGELLFAYAEKIVKIYEHLNYDLNSLTTESINYKIGVDSAISEYLMENIIAGNSFLNARFSLIKISASKIHEKIKEKELDFGLFCEEIDQEGVELKSLGYTYYSNYATGDLQETIANNKTELRNSTEYPLKNIYAQRNRQYHELQNYTSIIKLVQTGNFVAYIPDILVKDFVHKKIIQAFPVHKIKVHLQLMYLSEIKENKDFKFLVEQFQKYWNNLQ